MDKSTLDASEKVVGSIFLMFLVFILCWGLIALNGNYRAFREAKFRAYGACLQESPRKDCQFLVDYWGL